jgi:aspartate aminotransferase/aminotransferase
MKPFALAAQQMPRSGIRVILDLAARIPGVIHLEIGQPNFPTPPHIVEAAYQAMQHGFTGYTPNAGLFSLCEAIAGKARRENGLKASADNIVVTTGGMGGLYSTLAALLDPGDVLLVPDPGYPNYAMVAGLLGAAVARYPLDPANGFQPRLEALPGLVTPRTKAIVVNSPSNPTGAVLSPEVIAALVAFAHDHDLYLVSDECYEKIVFDGAQHLSPAALDAEGRVVSVFSFSKTYAMTGWRVGYTVAPTDLTAIIAKLQEATVACASSVSQKAAEAALAGPQERVWEMVNAYRRRRDLALAVLQRHGLPTYVPQGAFYLLVDTGDRASDAGSLGGSEQFARDLLTRASVAVAPGCTFGPLGDRYVRVSLATDENDLATGLERLCSHITHHAPRSTVP